YYSREDIGKGAAYAHLLQAQYHQNAYAGDQKAGGIKPLGIEQGNDENGDDVVDDRQGQKENAHRAGNRTAQQGQQAHGEGNVRGGGNGPRSEEHTSELQSRENLVCRLLLEKKKHQPD